MARQPTIPVTVTTDREPGPPLRRAWWLVRLLFVLTPLFLVPVFWRVWWGGRVEARWREAESRYRARLAKVDLPTTQTIPDAENAVTLLAHWAAAISGWNPHGPLITRQQVDVVSSDANRTMLRQARLRPGAWWSKDFRPDVTVNFSYDYFDLSMSPQLADAYLLAQGIDDDAIRSRIDDVPRALETAVDLLFLARVIRGEGSPAAFYLAWILDAWALDLVHMETIELKVGDDPSGAQVPRRERRASPALIRECVDRLLNDDDVAPLLARTIVRSDIDPPAIGREVALPDRFYEIKLAMFDEWLLRPLHKQKRTTLLNSLEIGADLALAKNWPAARRLPATLLPMDVAQHLGVIQFGSPSMVRRTTDGTGARIYFQRRLARRLLAVYLASHWYEAEHGGHIPPKLADLVPRYLSAVPIDPYDPDSKPLRYVATAATPFVYSVGENGIDDVGNGSYAPNLDEHIDGDIVNYPDILCFLRWF